MRSKRKWLAWWLVLMMALGMTVPAYADSNAHSSHGEKDVDKLISLGLIKGDGKGVTNTYLNKPATRLQASIIYLRLEGLEQEARAYTGKEAFLDSDAVSEQNRAILAYLLTHPHLGWLVSEGKRFEPQKQITAEEYASILLKVLGYDSGVDYKADSVLTFAKQKGLTLSGGGRLRNRDIVSSTYQALSLTSKNDQIAFLEKWTVQKNRAAYIPDVVANTRYGKVQGIKNAESQVISWLGVPYAKPPVGQLRWKSPQNPEPWTGKLQADQYQQSCIQTVNGKIIGSENCLYLNIWRPDQASSNLPVFVYVHGGGNVGGSGKDFVGDQLARSLNSIVITINYRLGAMGFFRHPALQSGNPADDSGNYGLLDIFQSLKWVQDNISQFGGDPANVTLSGQSAGARDVTAAVISPYGKGLFQKAVSLSGGMTTSDPIAGEEKAEDAFAKLVVADGKAATPDEARLWISKQSNEGLAAYLRQIKPENIAVYYTDPAIRMAPFPHLFRDGAVIPKEGFDRIASGDYNKVPMILGSEQTEFSVFAAFDPYFVKSLTDGSLLTDNNKLKLYQEAVKYGSELYAGFNVERTAEKLTARKDQPAVYGYRFAWGTRDGVTSPQIQALFGAAHGADLDFYTGHSTGLAMYFGKGYFNEENKAGRQELSAAMTGYLKYFLYTGNPNGQQNKEWKPWQAADGAERILRLDGEKDHAVIAMSNEYLRRDDTIKRMENELTDEDSEFLQQNIFAGRFFWD